MIDDKYLLLCECNCLYTGNSKLFGNDKIINLVLSKSYITINTTTKKYKFFDIYSDEDTQFKFTYFDDFMNNMNFKNILLLKAGDTLGYLYSLDNIKIMELKLTKDPVIKTSYSNLISSTYSNAKYYLNIKFVKEFINFVYTKVYYLFSFVKYFYNNYYNGTLILIDSITTNFIYLASPVKKLNSPTKSDVSELININKIIKTIPEDLHIKIATPPSSDVNLPRRFIIKLLMFYEQKLEYKDYDKILFKNAISEINMRWNLLLTTRIPPIVNNIDSVEDIVNLAIKSEPFCNFFDKNKWDLSYYEKYERINNKKLGCVIYVKDNNISHFYSCHYKKTFIFHEETSPEYLDALCLLAKTIRCEVSWKYHLFYYHIVNGVIHSQKLYETIPYNSELRKYLLPFMYDNISLIYDESEFLLDLEEGNIMKGMLFTKKGFTDFMIDSLNNYNIKENLNITKKNYSDLYDIVYRFVEIINKNNLKIQSEISTNEFLTLYIISSCFNHYLVSKYSYPILFLLNLEYSNDIYINNFTKNLYTIYTTSSEQFTLFHDFSYFFTPEQNIIFKEFQRELLILSKSNERYHLLNNCFTSSYV